MSNFGTYRMRIGFSGGRPTGVFTIGSSTIGGPDVLGHQFLVGYEGPYDDVTDKCTQFTLTRGRDNDTDPIPAGTLDVTLFDKDGIYNPKNQGLNYEKEVLSDSPIGYWRLGELAGVAVDEMGLADGTVEGTVTRGVTGLLSKDSDTAYEFDGATGKVTLGQVGPTPRGFAALVKTTYAGTSPIYSNRQAGDGSGTFLGVYFGIDSGKAFVWNQEAGGEAGITGLTTINDDQRHLVEYHYDPIAGIGRLYVDGVLDKEKSQPSITPLLDTNRHSIAWDHSNGDFFPDTIDEVVTFASPSSSAQVAARYSAAFDPVPPLYGKIKPLIPCLLEIQVGEVWYELFHGWLDEESAQTDWGEKQANVRFTDMFVWLDRAQSIIISATGPTNVGAAIGEVLDAIEWPSTNRSLQIGSSISDFFAVGDKKGTELITGLLEVDRGAFFVNRLGVPTYKDRHEPYRVSSSATFDVASTVVPGVSLSGIRNRARVTREVTDPEVPVQQSWQDDASIHEYGYSDWPEVTSPYFVTDLDALSLAKFLVWQGKNVTSNIWTMNVQEGETEASLAAIAQTDLLQKITVDTPAVGGDYIVQKIVHSGAGGQVHKMSIVLSEAPLEEAFIIGVSTIGSTKDVLVP